MKTMLELADEAEADAERYEAAGAWGGLGALRRADAARLREWAALPPGALPAALAAWGEEQATKRAAYEASRRVHVERYPPLTKNELEARGVELTR